MRLKSESGSFGGAGRQEAGKRAKSLTVAGIVEKMIGSWGVAKDWSL